MPTLITDTTVYAGGNENATIRGGFKFTADGIPYKEWSETYLVEADTPIQNETHILSTAGLPILGQPFRDAWCIDRQAVCADDSAKLWRVNCRYSTNVSPMVKNSTKENTPGSGIWYPVRLDKVPAQFSWSSETITEPLLEDQQVWDPFTGEQVRVTNTVGEPLYPESRVTIVTLTTTHFRQLPPPRQDTGIIPVPSMYDPRNYHANYNFTEEYENKVNSVYFLNAPPGCVLCSKLKVEELGYLPYYEAMMDENPADPPNLYLPYFLRITGTFQFRFWWVYDCETENWIIDTRPDATTTKPPQGWELRLLNQGTRMLQYRESDPTETEKEIVSGSYIDKSPVRVNLDELGFPIEDTEDLSKVYWLKFNRYKNTAFGPLFEYPEAGSNYSVLPEDLYNEAYPLPLPTSVPPCDPQP